MPTVYAIFRDGYGNNRIQAIYDDVDYANQCLDAFIEADVEQEYTWFMTSYDVKQKPTTET